MKTFIKLTALFLALQCNAQSEIKIGNESYIADTLIHVTVGPGMQTTGVRLSGASQSNAAVKANVFYTSIDLENPDLVLTGVQALDKVGGSENLLNMGKRKNAQGQLQYIAGVNGDHANLNGDYKLTNGITYIDDKLYNIGVGDSNWKMFESYVVVEGSSDISISESVRLSLPLKFPSGREFNIYLNTGRSSNYLVIYTPEYGSSTKTNGWGKECTMKLVEGSIIDCNAVFEITSEPIGGKEADGNMTIPRDGYVLSGVDMASGLVGQLKIGDRVEICPAKITINRVKPSDLTTIVGGCPVIVENGNPITAAECDKLNKTTAIQITPTARTAIGYNEDKSRMYLVVADSYKSNDHKTGDKAAYGETSSGLRFETLADFMIYLGCHTAMAMDGGGSSQLYNINLGICNIPYGLASYLRPVANGFFAANDSPDDVAIAAIEVLQKNVRLNEGESFTPKVYGYNKYGVLVNTDITDFSLSTPINTGSVSGNTFTAGPDCCTAVGIVTVGDMKCGVKLILNGGGSLIGNDEKVNFEIVPPYLSNEPAGIIECENSVESPGASKEYFSVNGSRIAEPQKGIYVVKHGKSAHTEVKL